MNNVWSIQIPNAATLPLVCGPASNAACTQSTFGYASAYQQFMFDNRQQTRGQFALDVVVLPRITVSPTIRYHDDYYGINPSYQEGIDDRKSLSWGADVAYAASGDFNLVFSYYKEYGYMSMYGVNIPHGAACGNVGCGPGSPGTTTYGASDNATVDTISAGAEWAAIPDKLQLNVRLALSKGSDQETLWQQSGAAPTGGQYPADTTWFTHLDATATYKFDPTWVRSLGWKGDVKAKLRYTWESNSVSNWQNDSVLPFSTTQGANLSALGVRQSELQRANARRVAHRQLVAGTRNAPLENRALVFAGESHALLSAGFSSVAVDGKPDAAQGRGGTRSRRNSLHSTLYAVWRVALFGLAALRRASPFGVGSCRFYGLYLFGIIRDARTM